MQTLSNLHKTRSKKIAISLTPLIDVVFILLIFFMLASSFQKMRSVELIPPQKGKEAAANNEEGPLIILVSGASHYNVNEQEYTRDSLNGFLDLNRDKSLQIKTSAKATLQDVVYLLDLTASLSLSKVSLLPFEEVNP